MHKKQVQVIFINLGEEGLSESTAERESLSDVTGEKEKYDLPEKNRMSLFVSEAESQYRYDAQNEDIFQRVQDLCGTAADIAETACKSVMQEAYQFLNEYKVARNHKDLLLRAIFRNKEEILSLYNGLNGSSYADASMLEITTLKFLCLTALIPLFLKNSVLVIVSVLLNFVLERWIYIVLCKYAQKDWFTCFDSVPFEAFLNIFLPVMAGIALTIQHIELVILPLGILVICAKSIKVKLDIANVYLKSLKDK